MPISEVECCDCMDFMAKFPDKFFDLAIVDPPYGLDKRLESGGGKMRNTPFKKLYREGNKWDKIPEAEYWNMLFRVSKNQIVWGGNYFPLPPTRGIICWDKKQALPTFSRWEYAWTSFDMPAKMFEGVSTDNKRIHPTQKPVALYIWLLENYAKPGDKILDTHMGSQSSRIAAWKMGFDYWGCEIDPEYFAQGCARFKEERRQLSLFTPPEKPKQEALF